MKVDRFDTDVRVEGVLVEENRTDRNVGHVKSFLKNIMFDIIRCLLPTCQWLGCLRVLTPRRSASSAALVDEPGSDRQITLDPLWPLKFERTVRDTL